MAKRMNFIQAMAVAHAGPNKSSVQRHGQGWFVWYDPTMFLGMQPFGFRYEFTGRDPIAYQPDPEDVSAEDWEVRTS